MPEPCGRTFDESWLSGYVDRALVQADDQRVRLHLEDCETCRAIVEQLRSLREATMSTSFQTPPDLQWPEQPRHRSSRVSFRLGWLLIGVWAATMTFRAGWAVWRRPWPSLDELVAFGAVLGLVLLLVGVLIDRLVASRTDRYRRVPR